MAQKRYFEFLDDDKTFDINSLNVGIIPKGIYAGYDVAAKKLRRSDVGQPDSYYLELSHTDTAVSEIDAQGDTLAPFSVLMTGQGVKITENAVVEIDFSSMPTTGTRYDYVICEHDYIPSAGGQQAVYSMIEGDETNNLTEIPNSENKVIVGIVKIGVSGLIEWKRSEVPQLGNDDIRKIHSSLKAMWSMSYPVAPIRPIDGVLSVPTTGNIFTIEEALTENNYLGKSIAFLPDYGNDFGEYGKRGTIVHLIASEDISFVTKSELDDIPYPTPIGSKPILASFNGVSLREGGIITLLEMYDSWLVIGVSDYEKNSFYFFQQLKNKNLWGFEPLFQSAVSLAAASTLMRQSVYSSNVSLDSNGLIQNGTESMQRNVYALNTTSNVAVLGLEVPFSIGAEVTIFFEGTDTVIHTNVSAFSNNQRIISRDGFPVLAAAGSNVTGIQKSDGFYLINGDSYETWESPTLPSNVSVIAANGTFKFKICRNGRIEFDGSILMSANSGAAVILTLPRSLFKFQDWSLYKRLFIPSFNGSPDGNNTRNHVEYFIDGSVVKFQIATDNIETTFNFNGCHIHYK